MQIWTSSAAFSSLPRSTCLFLPTVDGFWVPEGGVAGAITLSGLGVQSCSISGSISDSDTGIARGAAAEAAGTGNCRSGGY
jgi:hypothetical protein